VTIRPEFSGTVPIFNNVSWKKQFSQDAHLSRFWLSISNLSRFSHPCSCVHMHWWPKISQVLSVYKKIAGSRGSNPDPSGGAHDDPQIPSGPPMACSCLWLAPYNLHLWHLSQIVVPKVWSPYTKYVISEMFFPANPLT